jgi:hypothetical protein
MLSRSEENVFVIPADRYKSFIRNCKIRGFTSTRDPKIQRINGVRYVTIYLRRKREYEPERRKTLCNNGSR